MFSFADLHLLFKFDLKVSQKQKELDDKVRMVFSWDDQIHDAEIGQYDQKVKAAASKKVRSPFLHSGVSFDGVTHSVHRGREGDTSDTSK